MLSSSGYMSILYRSKQTCWKTQSGVTPPESSSPVVWVSINLLPMHVAYQSPYYILLSTKYCTGLSQTLHYKVYCNESHLNSHTLAACCIRTFFKCFFSFLVTFGSEHFSSKVVFMSWYCCSNSIRLSSGRVCVITSAAPTDLFQLRNILINVLASLLLM